MRRRIHRSSRIREIVTFWAMVAVLAVVLSGLGFVAAKYWVGGLMARSKAAQPGPQIVLKTPGDKPDEDSEMGPTKVEPPSQAVIKMQQRAPNDAEKSEIEQMYPQDAAELHKQGDQDNEDDSTGADDKPLNGTDADGTGGVAGGQYSVVASSYRDAANARREAERLAGRGYEARIVDITRDGQTFHRVVVASFDDRADAERMRDRLRQEGTAATITTR